MNPNTHYTGAPSHTLTDPHPPCYFMVLTGALCALRLAVSGVSALTRKQWQYCRSHTVPRRQRHTESLCTVRDMMHKVRAEPLDYWTRSAGLETGEVCQRTSHPPQLQVCSTCYGSGTAAPSGSHLSQEGYALKGNPVVEAPCPGPSDAVTGGQARVGNGKKKDARRTNTPPCAAILSETAAYCTTNSQVTQMSQGRGLPCQTQSRR